MHRRRLAAKLLVVFLLGCDTTVQDRVKDFNREGTILYRQGEYQAAREHFEQASELKPDDSNLLYNIGQCYERQGEWPKAESFYRKCLEQEPEHEDVRFALAQVLDRTGRRDEAARLANDWLVSHSHKAAPYALDGWRLRQDRAFPQARGRLMQALAIDPHCSRALVELGILYEQLGEPERSLILYQRSLEYNPRQPDVIDRLNELKAKNVGKPLPNR
ncbi:MAG: tetratricopeptide repeat protein [Planctomycetes bacterium]|nr:tetratricopeptide repeat protein [Planctomycetota bacterium]